MRKTFLPENEPIIKLMEGIPFWEIASKAGVHANTIQNWIKHKMNPQQKEKLLKAISEIKQELKTYEDLNESSYEDVLENLKNSYENQKREGTVMKGIYWESDVWDAIEKAAQLIGPKMNSRFVNDVMKKYLQENGYIRK